MEMQTCRDDRHRPDVHLLRHPGDADGDRVRLRLRSLHAPRRLLLRSVSRRAARRGCRRCTPFRRRLMPVPLGLDHPRWVDDPEFDLATISTGGALPAPGGEAEFTTWWPR